MKKYRVDTLSWSSREFDNLDEAEKEYENTKDYEMGEGVTEESYVELIYSKDDFEDHDVLKRSEVRIDEERMKISTPREEGFDWDYWAKWDETVERKYSAMKNSVYTAQDAGKIIADVYKRKE